MSEEELKKMGYVKNNLGFEIYTKASNLLRIAAYYDLKKHLITQIDYFSVFNIKNNNIDEVNKYYDELIKDIENSRKEHINLIQKESI